MNQLSAAMHQVPSACTPAKHPLSARSLGGRCWLAALLLASTCVSGCAALSNPLEEALPVRRLPPELLGESRQDKRTIPLTMLRQNAPQDYRLAPGDVLGVYIEGVLPATVIGQTPPIPPVYFPAQINLGRNLPPAVGFPFPIRDDGAVALPQLAPVQVRDKTVTEAQELISQAYLKTQILPAGREKIIVTLMQRRQYRVMVFRQEAGGFTSAGAGGLIASSNKRGTGNFIDLPAYENDVLSALAQTGGLPGLDVYNEVYIFKGAQKSPDILKELQNLPPGKSPLLLAERVPKIIHIPLRTKPGELPAIKQDDIVLDTGDVVFLEARDPELFYTGGLLPVGEFVLPRDYDLDVVKAVAQVKGPLVNGAGVTGSAVEPGMGNPSPSMLVVLRKLPNGNQIPILVDLNRAMRDPRERILVQPGDVLILQEMPSEALARYLTRDLFNFSLTWKAVRSRFLTGVVDISTPERIPARIQLAQ